MADTEYVTDVCPAQSDDVPLMVPAAAGKGLTDTLTESIALHPLASVTARVYVVVCVGVATGLEIFGLSRP